MPRRPEPGRPGTAARLAALRDLDELPIDLVGPADVRRRGESRTRHQRIATATASVVVVAAIGSMAVIGLSSGGSHGTHPSGPATQLTLTAPAVTPSASATVSAPPTATATPTPVTTELAQPPAGVQRVFIQDVRSGSVLVSTTSGTTTRRTYRLTADTTVVVCGPFEAQGTFGGSYLPVLFNSVSRGVFQQTPWLIAVHSGSVTYVGYAGTDSPLRTPSANPSSASR